MLTKPKKIRSNRLLEYLIATGALDNGKDAIVQAKLAYRKQYKKEWKQHKLMLHKELRISLTLRQYHSLQLTAYDNKLSPTAFARQQVLIALDARPCVPNTEILRQILQSISLTINDGLTDRLQTAEKHLIAYLNGGD
mgnify:CR=1 FL=1